MFWGCTIPARFPFIEKATRLTLAELGVDLVDVDGFTCCPETTLVKAADEDAYYLTAARNLAVADRQGLPLLTPCNGCYSTFKAVSARLKVDWRLKNRINEKLARAGLSVPDDLDVWHLVEWLSEDFGPSALSKRVTKPLAGMKIAVHYGCHLLRPSPAVRWDSPTAPVKFEQLVRALGVTVVEYETKMDCCGNALDRVGERQASLALCRRKLSNVADHGADALVVSCPSCFQQFDLNQATLLRESGEAGVPVFYFTELLGLAMGMSPDGLGLDMHRVSVLPFLERWATRLGQREVLARTFTIPELQTCASCAACDVDCPVAQTDDSFVPSAVIARLLTDDLDEVLASPQVWQCVDCLTCFEKCHSRIGMAKVFERLKNLAREQGKIPAAASAGYQTFLASGSLGSGRASVRAKLGLPDQPAGGIEELRGMLDSEEEE